MFLILLILFHGQAQMERGFSINKLLLDVNMQNETLVAQQIVHDHIVSENMKPHDLQMTKHLMELEKDARKSYILQRDRFEKVENLCRGKAGEDQ